MHEHLAVATDFWKFAGTPTDLQRSFLQGSVSFRQPCALRATLQSQSTLQKEQHVIVLPHEQTLCYNLVPTFPTAPWEK